MLRLGDVARLELGASSLDRQTRFNGGPASVLAIVVAIIAFLLAFGPSHIRAEWARAPCRDEKPAPDIHARS